MRSVAVAGKAWILSAHFRLEQFGRILVLVTRSRGYASMIPERAGAELLQPEHDCTLFKRCG